MNNLQKIVHFDFKGAPWRVHYLSKVISAIKNWGATGVLLEWEDTFPYSSDLICIGSLGGCSRDGLYSHDEIEYILQFIKDRGLTPIQYVPILSHMEFVLKHGKYSCLREQSRVPCIICPSRPECKTLIKAMIRQLFKAQPDAQYIHIGCDGTTTQPLQVKMCVDCKKFADTHEYRESGIFLEHVSAIATYIKSKYPKVTVLIWDDFLKNIPETALKAYKFGDKVQPVVCNYLPQQEFKIDIQLWSKYHSVFPNIWAGSAFKGAFKSCQVLAPVERYVSNQEAWIEELKVYDEEIKFVGVIFTGWSRFDHYATLCELLPVAMPSLASCLKIWTKPENVPRDEVVSDTLPVGEWPGEEVAKIVQRVVKLRENLDDFLNGEQISTWMNTWQVLHDYTAPYQVETIVSNAITLGAEVTALNREVSFRLREVTGARSAAEWWGAVLGAAAARLDAARDTATRRAASGPPVVPAVMQSEKQRTLE